MKNIKYILLVSFIFSLYSCTLNEVTDPNRAGLFDITDNPSAQNLRFLAQGLESRTRNGMGNLITATGSIARELYDFNSSDPTTTATLIGKDGAALNGSEPQLTGLMFARYQAVKSADFILDMTERSVEIDESVKKGYRGYANTLKAYVLLDILNLLGTNGIRIDVVDPDNLGPYLSESESYQAIRSMLDTGYSELQGGADFDFDISAGFEGFNTPATFAQFNRAIAARVATRQGDYAAALSYVDDSFLTLDANNLNVGPKKLYSISGGDLVNVIFKAPQQSGDQYVVHNRFITDIQAGDTRINKFRLRDDPVERDGLNGTHEINLYEDVESPIDHIRNEELILIYAEGNIHENNLGDAVTAIDIIRNAHGLADYSGAVTQDDLIDELLYHRGYSLWAEGHAMFDLRRYDRLNSTYLPIDRAGDVIHTQFPIPPFEN